MLMLMVCTIQTAYAFCNHEYLLHPSQMHYFIINYYSYYVRVHDNGYMFVIFMHPPLKALSNFW